MICCCRSPGAAGRGTSPPPKRSRAVEDSSPGAGEKLREVQARSPAAERNGGSPAKDRDGDRAEEAGEKGAAAAAVGPAGEDLPEKGSHREEAEGQAR